MPATYEPIATTTLGSAAASVTFSSISGTYTDLVLVANWGSDVLGFIYPQVNSDTGSNYSSTWLFGDGSSSGSSRVSSTDIPWASGDTGIGNVLQATTFFHFMNYSNSTTYKSWLSRMNGMQSGSFPGTAAGVGLWRNTNAITSIVLKTRSSGTDRNFISGSTFTLYGIKSA